MSFKDFLPGFKTIIARFRNPVVGNRLDLHRRGFDWFQQLTAFFTSFSAMVVYRQVPCHLENSPFLKRPYTRFRVLMSSSSLKDSCLSVIPFALFNGVCCSQLSKSALQRMRQSRSSFFHTATAQMHPEERVYGYYIRCTSIVNESRMNQMEPERLPRLIFGWE